MPGAGYNLWVLSPPNFGGSGGGENPALVLGLDNNLMAFYLFGVPFGVPFGGALSSGAFYTFSYSPPLNIPPAAVPGPIPFNASSIPPLVPTFPTTVFLCMDALDRVWIFWETDVVAVFVNHLQSYDVSTGNILSDTVVSGGSQSLADFGTSFIVAGEYYLAVWYATFSTLIGDDTQVTLEVFNITGGAPVSIGTITMPLDPSGFSIGYGYEVFCDGANTLWFFQYALDDPSGGEPTGGTLHKVDFPSMTIVASASYVGPYAFIGNPADGHIYLLNIDGSVSDVDPVTLSIINTYPLGVSIAPAPGPAGSAFRGEHYYPFLLPWCTHLMKNSTFGISTDFTCANQFFLTVPSVFGPIGGATFTRIQNLQVADTLALYTDWGIPGFNADATMWVPWRQSMLSVGALNSSPGHVSASSTAVVLVEFMYTCSVCNATLEFR